MSGSASISGLASGLDTASIISQLMQLEAAPQGRLKTQVSTQQTAVKTLQGINTKVASLLTQAQDLAKPTAWTSVAATSSSEHATVTTAAGAVATALSFTIQQTARSHQLTFADTAALDAGVVPAGSSLLLDRLDGSPAVTIDAGDGTLQGLVDAINGSGQGIRAVAVRLDDGTSRLRVESSTTGASSDFTLARGDGTPLLGGATATAGRDAAIVVGPDTIRSPSNTYADLLPGVTVALAANTPTGTVVDVDLATDGAAMAGKVRDLVDTLNGVLGEIDSATKAGGSGIKAGPLAGDSSLRSVRDQLLSTLYSAAGGSLADVGIELDKYGKVTFDEDRFVAAYQSDPVATAGRFVEGNDAGYAARLASVTEIAGDSYDGTLSLLIKGRNTTIDRLNDSIESWDQRLELRRTTLTRQFTALETALSRMNSQSSWLAGQISSLSTSSS